MNTMQFNPRTPGWVSLKLMIENIDDETDLIQFGQTDH